MPRGALLVLLGATAPVGFGQCEPVWSGLDGLDGHGPSALAVYDDDGAGPLPPALFIAGGLSDIRTIARWDGWSASAVDGPHESYWGLKCFEAVPQPTGMLPAGLYAGGEITLAGGVPVNNLARWQAPDWHDVGGGVTSAGFVIVFDMLVFDEDGAGPLAPALFVAGQFQAAGPAPSVPAEGLARWDGAQWSAVGGSLSTLNPRTWADGNALAVYDDGRGDALYVGGSFDHAGALEAANIARWDGASWEPVGGGLDGAVKSLCIFDEDGAGPKRPSLFVGGEFSSAGGGAVTVYRIARWDGAQWTDVGGFHTSGTVQAMTVWDQDGPGPRRTNLYCGGFFTKLPGGVVTNKIARWDGASWHPLGEGVTGFGVGTQVTAFGSFDEDGPGPNPGGLYVGGLFYYAGGVYSKHIARWGCPLPATPPCPADCDGDTELTFFDFLCFQNQFAFGDTRADCDGDGSLTFFDFLCFQNQFSAGCP